MAKDNTCIILYLDQIEGRIKVARKHLAKATTAEEKSYQQGFIQALEEALVIGKNND